MRYQYILVTGATGFLGTHIVEYLLRNTKAVVYCLVRAESQLEAQNKLQKSLYYYFHQLEFDQKRLKVIRGDFAKTNLGMTNETWKSTGEIIEAVIHTGALVKHFGMETDFQEANIQGTQNVIEFAKRYSIFMIYISTMAVAGRFHKQKNMVFSEKNFMSEYSFPQNVYVRSKALSEENMVRASFEGLNCNIIRIGSITGRSSDGRFQRNKADNALYGRVEAIVRSGVIPRQLLEIKMEFSPVDCCSEAIVQVLMKGKTSFEIYHLYNINMLSYGELVKLLNGLGYIIRSDRLLSYRELKVLTETNHVGKAVHTGFCLFMRNLAKAEKYHKVDISCEKTLSDLKSMGFVWPQIDSSYIKKMINEICRDEEEVLSKKDI